MKGQPWRPDLCIYHANCDDGFGAAWAIWTRWPDCRFEPCNYGQPLPAVKRGENVLFVDFSASRTALLDLAKFAGSVVVLDHHKTAEAELAPFRWPAPDLPQLAEQLPQIIRHNPTGVVAVFDMERSGAALAWQFAHGRAALPQMLAWIEDRDLWKFRHGDKTRAFSAALRIEPKDFARWSEINTEPASLLPTGEIVLRAHRGVLAGILRQAYTMAIGGRSVPAVNCTYHYASDAAHELLIASKAAPFAVAWFLRGDGKVQFSLRSEDRRDDVSEIARGFGGGGHRNAAGFEIEGPGWSTMVAREVPLCG